MTPVLETDRLRLVAPQPRHLAPWMDFLVTERGRWHGGGPDEGPGRAWRIVAILTGHWQLLGTGPFVAELKETGAPVGSVGPFIPADWPEREIGWSVWRAEDEGKGYGVESSRAVIRHVFDDLGWDTAVSYIKPDNPRSIALAKRLGAKLDDAAPRPQPIDLVYRHPRPAA